MSQTCKEPGCSYVYATFDMLQDHVNFGEHGLNVQPQEGIYDRLRRQWAYKFSTLSLTDYSRKEKKQPAGQERASPKEVWKSEGEGWALQKPRGGSTRFSETVKSFLKDRFNAGAQTGRKADPAQVSADIRKVRNTAVEFSKLLQALSLSHFDFQVFSCQFHFLFNS